MVTVAELRSSLGIPDSGSDTALQAAVSAAERQVAEVCGRSFAVPTATETRTFAAWHPEVLMLEDEIASTSGLVVATDDNDDGTAETTWAAGDYELAPFRLAGQYRPCSVITAVGSRYWPTTGRRRRVSITALWGWSTVPDVVRSAALMVAKDVWQSKDIGPGGVVGFGEFGAVRASGNRLVMELLREFVRKPVIGGVGR